MSVMKKQFTWKFGYPRFQKKLKLNFEKEDQDLGKSGQEFAWDETDSCSSLVLSATSESVCWNFGDRSDKCAKKKSVVKEFKSLVEVKGPETVQEAAVNSEKIYSNLVELAQHPIYENHRFGDDENVHLYENAKSVEPLYENCEGALNDYDIENIYEHVDCRSPVNVFFGLLQSDKGTISPDPNIYEVPPGAIVNTNLSSAEEPDTKDVKPPEGFQDYENVCWESKLDNEEELFSLPVDIIYPRVVKPKRKNVRPALSAMLYEENVSVQNVNSSGSETTNNDMNNVTGNDASYAECVPTTEHVGETNVDVSIESSCAENSKLGPTVDNVISTTENSNETANIESAITCKYITNVTDIDTCVISPEQNSLNASVDKCETASENCLKDALETNDIHSSKETAHHYKNVDKVTDSDISSDNKEHIHIYRDEDISSLITNNDCTLCTNDNSKCMKECGHVAVLEVASDIRENRDLPAYDIGIPSKSNNEGYYAPEGEICKSKDETDIAKQEDTLSHSKEHDKQVIFKNNTDSTDCKDLEVHREVILGYTEKEDSITSNENSTSFKDEHESKDVTTELTKSDTVYDASDGNITDSTKTSSCAVPFVETTTHIKEGPVTKEGTSKFSTYNDGVSSEVQTSNSEHDDTLSHPGEVISEHVKNNGCSVADKEMSNTTGSHNPIDTEETISANTKNSAFESSKGNDINDCKLFNEESVSHIQSDKCMYSYGNNADNDNVVVVSNGTSVYILDVANECASNLTVKNCSEERKETNSVINDEGEKAPVIEISDDGTWETKTLPATELDNAKQEDHCQGDEPEFLCALNRSEETVKMTYGSQYYVNCPVASVKPMKHDSQFGVVDDDTGRNIGAQIMKKYEEDRQKLRENLPDVSLLDVDASMEDIQRERRRIIENQAVRAKRIDSWIKNGGHPGEIPDEHLEVEKILAVEDTIHEIPSSVQSIILSTGSSEDITGYATPTAEIEACMSKLSTEGEVVYDSIIQNKHKTKSYWEQLMMAAESSKAPFKRDFLSLNSDGEDGKPSSDVSEQEYYDARSQISLHSPTEPLDSLDHPLDIVSSGPKIIETVAKKLMETESVKLLNKSGGEESVIEREIRLQREREEALVREREDALLSAATVPSSCKAETSTPSTSGTSLTTVTPSTNPAETKIALELREMREREEELRRLRQKLNKEDTDDGFNSIPNTDEGNFSEYGSEEKELSLDGNNSRMMSPEVPPSPGNFLHQRTQSMDSMSSGHSSGSGSGSGNADITAARRRVTVKPLDEPDDEEIPSYMMRGRSNIHSSSETSVIQRVSVRNQKETPIEREIRLAREREEELRREKRLPPLNSQTAPITGKQEVRRINNRNALLSNDPRSVQHRLATSRIQQEIDEATEREKELREAGTIQTMSEETVDSKVTRFTDLAEFAIEERDRKLYKSMSVSHIPQSVTETDGPVSPTINSKPKIKKSTSTTVGQNSIGRTLSPSPSIPALSPRKFTTTLGQKGLMQRFLANRGKMGTLSSGFVTVPTSRHNVMPVQTPYVPPAVPNKPVDATSLDEQQLQLQEGEEKENGDSQRTLLRRGYISAEEKIQVELQEMQKREEELRMQRARIFARSQPNLLCLGDEDEEEENLVIDRDMENHSPLRTTLSNPNLLEPETTHNGDGDSSLEKPSLKTIRKRSALIAQWENIIQKNTDH